MSTTIPVSGKIRNPKTGRMIEIGKGTYNKLIKDGYTLVGTTLQIQPHSLSSGKDEVTSNIGSITSQLSSIQISPFQSQLHQQIYNPNVSVLGKAPNPLSETERLLQSDIPETATLKEDFIESITHDRTKMCNICSSYYLKRISELRPFTTNPLDYKLLKQTIVPACEQCESLLNQEISLNKRDPNSFELYRRYKQAAIKSRETLGQVESRIRTSGIMMSSHGGVDPEIFFPKIPDTDPS